MWFPRVSFQWRPVDATLAVGNAKVPACDGQRSSRPICSRRDHTSAYGRAELCSLPCRQRRCDCFRSYGRDADRGERDQQSSCTSHHILPLEHSIRVAPVPSSGPACEGRANRTERRAPSQRGAIARLSPWPTVRRARRPSPSGRIGRLVGIRRACPIDARWSRWSSREPRPPGAMASPPAHARV
jgi:hypothetical protein